MRTSLRMPAVTGYEGRYDSLHETDSVGLVEWSPGDATRYLLIAAELDFLQALDLGFSPDTHVAIVSVGCGDLEWSTVVIPTNVLMHEGYFAEKAQGSRLTDYTIRAYTALINMVIGDEKYGIELAKDLFSQRGLQ